MVDIIIDHLRTRGFLVAKEVGNFHRSADIVAISPDQELWIIEGKLSAMKHAARQLRDHKLSADKIFVGTPMRKLKKSTKEMFDRNDIGIIFVNKDLSIEVLPHKNTCDPFMPIRNQIFQRVLKRETGGNHD